MILKIIQLVKHLLNKIKKAETKNKRLINGQKILLNLFDDLIEAIINNNKIVNEDNNDDNDNDNEDDDYDSDNDDEITVKRINNDLKKMMKQNHSKIK